MKNDILVRREFSKNLKKGNNRAQTSNFDTVQSTYKEFIIRTPKKNSLMYTR